MEIHKLLGRQLTKAQLQTEQLPENLEKWQEFITRINKSYQEADQERYLLERSMEISSREMMMLNKKLENAQHIARLGYWQYDGDTQAITWSNEVLYIFNLNLLNSALSYNKFLHLVHPDERETLQNLMKKAFAEKVNYEHEIRVKNPDGHYRWYRIIAHFQNKKNQLSGVIIDINKDKEAEAKIKELNQRLLVTARRAGMSEIATSILHNIGNVLNSSNISLNLLKDSFTQPYHQKFLKVIGMIKEHLDDLPDYLTNDTKGKLIPEYLIAMAEMIENEYQKNTEELNSIDSDLQHIKGIVAMQQTFSGVSGVAEKIFIPELIETALQMSSNPAKDCAIEMVKQYIASPFIITDKSKLLQILVNLIQNAKDAVWKNSGNKEKQIKFIVEGDGQKRINIQVMDNGIGIPAEYLSRIFSFGFTTKKSGHGFGLHSCALSAQDMGGSLKAESKGLGEGAAFILTLPVRNNRLERRVFNE